MTIKRIGGLLCVVATLASPGVTAEWDLAFGRIAMRLDLYHTGTAEFEHFSLDRVRIEGPWPGSRTQLLDTTNLGKYRFEVVDIETNQVIYSRGFASIYGEWETSYCQMLCMATSGGDPVFADSVDKLDSLDDVGEASIAL